MYGNWPYRVKKLRLKQPVAELHAQLVGQLTVARASVIGSMKAGPDLRGAQLIPIVGMLRKVKVCVWSDQARPPEVERAHIRSNRPSQSAPLASREHAASVDRSQGLLSFEARDPAKRCLPAANRL